VEVAAGVHRVSGGIVNFYLVEEGGKLVLVNAGAPGDWRLLVRTVEHLGRRLDDLDAVLITHAHAPEALASLAALESAVADTLLPGHGEPWTGSVAEAVRLARAAGSS
jgi:glyoxylase-like metal-dependent hydrolase (beta-lactamase superfamily II)